MRQITNRSYTQKVILWPTWCMEFTLTKEIWIWWQSHDSHAKGCFKSEETGEFFRCQNEYSKSLSWAENLNIPPKTVTNFFKFSAKDSNLEYLFWQQKNSSVCSDLKPPLRRTAKSTLVAAFSCHFWLCSQKSVIGRIDFFWMKFKYQLQTFSVFFDIKTKLTL